MSKGTPILLGFLLLLPAGAANLQAEGEPDKTIVIRDGEVIRLDGDEAPFVLLDGSGRRGYIGVRPLEMTPDLRVHYGAPKDAGVLVGEVEANGPAARAGLQVGDIVTSVDGVRVESGADLSHAIRSKKEGESVQLDILRDKAKKTLTVAVAERKRQEVALDRPRAERLPRERSFVLPDFEVRMPRRMDLDRLNEKLEELDRRLRELEKNPASR